MGIPQTCAAQSAQLGIKVLILTKFHSLCSNMSIGLHRMTRFRHASKRTMCRHVGSFVLITYNMSIRFEICFTCIDQAVCCCTPILMLKVTLFSLSVFREFSENTETATNR